MALSNDQERFGGHSEMVFSCSLYWYFSWLSWEFIVMGLSCIVCCLMTFLPLPSRGQLWHPKCLPQALSSVPWQAKLPQLETTVSLATAGLGGEEDSQSPTVKWTWCLSVLQALGGSTVVLFSHAHPVPAGNGKTIIAGHCKERSKTSVHPKWSRNTNERSHLNSASFCFYHAGEEGAGQEALSPALHALLLPSICWKPWFHLPTPRAWGSRHIHSQQPLRSVLLSGGGCKMGLLSNSGLTVPLLKSPDLERQSAGRKESCFIQEASNLEEVRLKSKNWTPVADQGSRAF